VYKYYSSYPKVTEVTENGLVWIIIIIFDLVFKFQPLLDKAADEEYQRINEIQNTFTATL